MIAACNNTVSSSPSATSASLRKPTKSAVSSPRVPSATASSATSPSPTGLLNTAALRHRRLRYLGDPRLCDHRPNFAHSTDRWEQRSICEFMHGISVLCRRRARHLRGDLRPARRLAGLPACEAKSPSARRQATAAAIRPGRLADRSAPVHADQYQELIDWIEPCRRPPRQRVGRYTLKIMMAIFSRCGLKCRQYTADHAKCP